jgi:hypothetical protein
LELHRQSSRKASVITEKQQSKIDEQEKNEKDPQKAKVAKISKTYKFKKFVSKYGF